MFRDVNCLLQAAWTKMFFNKELYAIEETDIRQLLWQTKQTF